MADTLDDIEMLLPGLKVSSSLVRQRPLQSAGPSMDSHGLLEPSVGTKRRSRDLWGEADAAPASEREHFRKRFQATDEARPEQLKLTRRPSLSDPCVRSWVPEGACRLAFQEEAVTSAPSEDGSGPLSLMEAGLTSAMLQDLNVSPKKGLLTPSLSGQSMATLSACSPLARGASSEVSSEVQVEKVEEAGCAPAAGHRGGSGFARVDEGDAEVEGTASSSDDEDNAPPTCYTKTRSAPSRLCKVLEQSVVRTEKDRTLGDFQPSTCQQQAGEQLQAEASHHSQPLRRTSSKPPAPRMPLTHNSAGFLVLGGGGGSGAEGQRGSLSRTEKWHERICMATQRLRARSLPPGPQREADCKDTQTAK